MDRQLAFPTKPPPRPGLPARTICARGLAQVEQRLQPILLSADRFGSEAPGRLIVGSPEGSLTLRRPAEPVLNPFGQTSVNPAILWGEWRVAAFNGRPPTSPMHLIVFRDRLELISGCVGFGRLIEPGEAGLLLTEDPSLRTTCERMTSPDERAAQLILSGTLRQNLIEPRRRTLQGAGGSISLVR